MTKTILVKAVTRSATVQKITGALDGVVKQAELEAALANCSALINQIDAGLSVKKLFLNISSAAELYFILSLPLLLSRRPHQAHESVSRRSSPSVIDAAGDPAPANPSPC